MFALLLWFALGWRAGAAELLVELAIGVALYGGGGGRRIRRALAELDRLPLRAGGFLP